MNIDLQSASLNLPFLKTKKKNPEDMTTSRWLKWMPDRVRAEFVAIAGEYVGTVLFLFFAFSGTQVANTQPTGGDTLNVLFYIAISFGFSLAVNAWVFYRITGGLFNPAVTVAMCLIGAVNWLRGVGAIIAQILGGMTAAALVSCMFPGPLLVRTTLSAGTSIAQGLFIEMFLTAELIFTIFMLAAEKHKGTFIAPIGIGLALFIAELSGVYFTGGSLNPARSFGPDVVLKSFNGYHWIYWVGPFLGSLLATTFYKLIKMLEYESANPGQDRSDKEQQAMDPDFDPEAAPKKEDNEPQDPRVNSSQHQSTQQGGGDRSNGRRYSGVTYNDGYSHAPAVEDGRMARRV